MSLLRKLAVLGMAAEAARRYAQSNPEKIRQLAEKAARFADQRTKGRYTQQIEQAKNALADAGGFAPPHRVVSTAEVINRSTPYRRG